jgi:hypothetical protein
VLKPPQKITPITKPKNSTLKVPSFENNPIIINPTLKKEF